MATHEVRLAGEQPVLLHGGGLLGVVLNKPGPGATGGWGSGAACGRLAWHGWLAAPAGFVSGVHVMRSPVISFK